MPALVPLPRSLESLGGSLRLPAGAAVVAGDGPPEVREVADLLAAELERSLAALPPVLPAGSAGGIHLDPSRPDLGPEDYELAVGPGSVRIRAAGARGLFYGAQTLLQLLPPGAPELPCVRIVDGPRLPWRGLMLDVSRHFFGVETVKRVIDICALHKLNRFHWHLTDDQGWRLAVRQRPRLVEVGAWRDGDGRRYGGFYGPADVAEVVEHARRRFVEVVPEIDMPGHAVSALAAYPELSCTGGPFSVPSAAGIYEDLLCPGNEATFDLVGDVLDELARLFPGRHVHVGGDECGRDRWQGCPRCRERMRREGLRDTDALYSWFVRRVGGLVWSQGRRPVSWDEALAAGPVPGTVIASWRGEEPGVAAARAGYDVVFCPRHPCYLDYRQADLPGEPGTARINTLRDAYAWEPVPAGLSAAQAHRVLGGQGNLWTELVDTPERLETMLLPRLCALAEALWSPAELRGWDGFAARLPVHLARLARRGLCHRAATAEGSRTA